MNIKQKVLLLIMLIVGVSAYGQDDNFQRIATIRMYCQLVEQLMPNSGGSLAWGLIRYLNPSFDEKLETVTGNGLKRIGLCQIPEDIVEIVAKDKEPNFAYTYKGSISTVVAFYQIMRMQSPSGASNDFMDCMTIWCLLHGLNGLNDISDPSRVLRDDRVRSIMGFASSFRTGGF